MIESIPYVLTGIGIIISILYYTSVLRNANKTQQIQLDTRQAQLLMQIYNRMDTPEKAKAVNHIMKMKFSSFEELIRDYIEAPDQETWNYVLSVVIMLEGQGVMIKQNYVKIESIGHLLGGFVVFFWNLFDSYKTEIREYLGYSKWASETEYLYTELMKYYEEHPELAT